MTTLKSGKIFLAGAFILLASPAWAGFQWKGSAPQKPAPVRPSQDAVIWQEAMPAPVMPAEKVDAVESKPVALVPAHHMTPSETIEMPKEAEASPPTDAVSGFGKDLPLVIALQQVVPAGYQYSFSGGAEPGAQVSWEGGKPWQDVLREMLSNTGLSYRLQGNVVVVSKASAPAEEVEVSSTPRMEKPEVAKEETEKPLFIRREKPSDMLNETLPPLPAEETVMPLNIINAAPPAPEPLMTSATTPQWQALQGQTLRDVLHAWASVAGVELYWSIDYDYRVNQDMAFNGTFDEAAGSLLDKYASARPQPYGQLHQSGDGPRVLVINSYDLTN